MKKIGTVLTLLSIILSLCSTAIAGTTGKIVGQVTDAKTGEPLVGVNIILVGTSYGAVTDFEGNYLILNLQPGSYTIRASSIGYSPLSYSNIRVASDLTTRQEFKMTEETVVGDEVVITAERPLVQKDLTSTTAVVGGDDIKQLPVTEISQVINLQAGNVAGSIRGGRSGETAYWIDGVPVTDVFNGSAVVDVNPSMVQELQVLSGAFNAEYGQAMSGIVNIVTREGAEKYSGSITAYAGDFLSNHSNIFKGIQKFEPFNIANIEGSLSGPLVGKDVSLYLNGRSIHYGGYLNGIRRYTPSSAVAKRFDRDEVYILGTDRFNDSIYVRNNYTAIPGGGALIDSLNRAKFDSAYSVFKNNYTNGTGDGKTVPMAWNDKLYLQAKLAMKITPELKLNITGIYDDVESQGYNRDFQYNPDGQGKDYTRSYTGIFQLTHTLSTTTFYTLGGSYFEKTYKHYLYENPYDPRYTHPDLANLGRAQSTYSYSTGGSDLGRYQRGTTTGLIKFDLSSQITNEHFVKAGAEVRQHKVFMDDLTLRPIAAQTSFKNSLSSPYISTYIESDSSSYHDTYTHKPVEISGYLQDKMEFKDLIINIGVRVDYFEPDANVLADDEDPNIYSPAKITNTFFDTNGNGIQDGNEPAKTVTDRRTYWFKKASSKFKISPRFGASFPITDRGVIHFSYGHFFQTPNFERLYANPGFKVGEGTGNVDHKDDPTGNADLKPEQTINGEIGLQQQLTDDMSIDVTAYLRDIRNLTGSRADQIPIGGGFASRTYTKYVNSDFGFVRGFILSLDKRFAQGMSLALDYTFQIARGSASDPNQARDQVSGGRLPEVQLTPLGWDQRHTINAIFSYSEDTWGGSIISQYGSGTPYTPDVTSDVTVFLTNSEIKPSYFNTDLRMYKNISIDALKVTLFMRVNNLFDTKNETGVYGDTGRAGETKYEREALLSGQRPYINTIADYYTNPQNYSEPRRIEVGATIEF